MKTRFLIIAIGVTSLLLIFALFLKFPFEKEHYEIKISGLNDAYLIGESFAFGYTISGHGNPCGKISINMPDENGDSQIMNTLSDCNAYNNMQDFEYSGTFDSNDTFAHPGIKNPGIYNVSVTYEHGVMEPTIGGKTFHVVEKICDDSDSKAESQCFAESYKSCKSSYMSQQFLIENNTVFLRATVENDCKITVYTENSLGEHTPFNGIRSICENVTVSENVLNFENCNNADYPPIIFAMQKSEPESKIECYALFGCNIANQNFEECVNSYQHGFTVTSICSSSNVTINGGCVNVTFSNGSGMTSCE